MGIAITKLQVTAVASLAKAEEGQDLDGHLSEKW